MWLRVLKACQVDSDMEHSKTDMWEIRGPIDWGGSHKGFPDLVLESIHYNFLHILPIVSELGRPYQVQDKVYLNLLVDGGLPKLDGRRICVIVDIGAVIFEQIEPSTGILWHIEL